MLRDLWTLWLTLGREWSGWESNPRPPACKAGALPTELPPRRSRCQSNRMPADFRDVWGLIGETSRGYYRSTGGRGIPMQVLLDWLRRIIEIGILEFLRKLGWKWLGGLVLVAVALVGIVIVLILIIVALLL